MSANDSFLETLKKIGYLEVDSLDDSNFDSVISEKELRSFFEVFCTLNEKNVLTTEEIEQYSALTPAELAEIEIWKKNGKLDRNKVEHEKKKQVLFLQEQLVHIENHNKSIERQVELFKKHEEHLLTEKEFQQNLLLVAKKKFQSYEMNKVPQAEEEFVSSLKSIFEAVQNLEIFIVHSDASENKLPTSSFFKDIVQQYLEAEEKVLQCVNVYLQKYFQTEENGALSVITIENSHRQELVKEASFLHKILKNSMIDKVLTEKDTQKLESMVKYFETDKIYEVNCNSSLLRYKLDDSLKLNEQLKKKEEELKAYAFDAVSKHVDALLTEVDSSASNEACNNLQFCIEKMSLPMKTLMHQRARVELLITSLNEHKGELQNLKDIIQKVLNKINQEKLDLEERKILIENEITDHAKKENELHPEAIIFSSLYRILTVSEDSDLDVSKVPITDVVQNTNKLFEAKENCEEKSKERMKIVDLIEKHAHCMESLLKCTGKEFSDWHELEQELNVSLNNLHMKLKSLEGNISECNQDLDQKQKILERKGNLRLARSLYLYALLNKELFKKCIDDIKIAIENSVDYKS